MRKPKREIPTERQALYYVGMVAMGIGFLLFISVFFSDHSTLKTKYTVPGTDQVIEGFAGRADHSSTFVRGFAGMGLIIVGSTMMAIGRKGLAGSGIILDPQQAREDVEPWSRAAGGMISDAISEVDALDCLGQASQPQPLVKVRCRGCGALNDEHAKFCNQCSAAI